MAVERNALPSPVHPSIQPRGLTLDRFFTTPNHHPFDLVRWERRTARITGADGRVVFEQEGVEVPEFWSQTATNIVAQKYFHGRLGTPEREFSVRQLIGRVVETLTAWGTEGGYFADQDSAEAFAAELTHLLLHQMASFNSPVWFNLGVEPHPQCSACFINSLQDSMESILDLAKIEGMLFKYGSGTGTNFSVLRSSREPLAGGGVASGPVSFMRGFDAFAGVIKSGGKTRRAAKMVILNVDHPDIVAFIKCKAEEEKKAHALIAAGYHAGFEVEGGAYDSVQYQNANHSVRVTDEFMRAVEEDGWWETRAVTTGEVMGRYRARELMRMMAEAAWVCGDPGIQYDTTINRWHTCKTSGRINASNPCSEYMFLDDTACNLASLNLLKFVDEEGAFQVEAFRRAVDTMILAQEIIVDFAHYPTAKIAANSHEFRTLGLGYANLGALLMAAGLPYDSAEGRALAAAITALMTGEAYLHSARMAQAMGPFPGFPLNREPMLEVIAMHRDAAHRLPVRGIPADLREAAVRAWDEALALGERVGYRNAQVTVLAPTGTIGFMMDCDTTGVEPDLALVKVKRLVGGGTMRIVNNTVPKALRRLGYSDQEREAILAHIEKTGSAEGAPHLKEEHLPVFDCAFKAVGGTRFITPMGHLRMMAAVQPFISGAISKTVNVPEETTPEEIERLYMEGWKLGLKAVAVYRDNCKGSQPLAAGGKTQSKLTGEPEFRPVRRKLPDERVAITHKFSVEGQEGYVTVGLYEDGTPGELFITMAKEGSTLSGVMDAFATAISLTLQYGVPLEFLVNKFSHVRFEPSGWTNNPQIPYAKSIIDYIFRWLASKFLSPEQQAAVGVQPLQGAEQKPVLPNLPAQPRLFATGGENGGQLFINQADAPPCPSCGMVMVRNGACYKCLNCGTVHGCS
ncbi:MAG: vitamin B12-dependent ribonucleotide reductase [Thermoanaerobaculum sp.]|nr:vitamin B12-dependent ribonucleotide reductase [Thermoanaerobaculum sp.]MDW7967290.1 vitamin B12-dependent ribonucleotide reductase [Thermoanaerobaculum sp.]